MKYANEISDAMKSRGMVVSIMMPTARGSDAATKADMGMADEKEDPALMSELDDNIKASKGEMKDFLQRIKRYLDKEESTEDPNEGTETE